MASRGTRQRQTVAAILSDLRRGILSGKLGPGARLPTREALAARFRASKTTVQKAIDHLLRDGLARPRGAAGTCVSAKAAAGLPYGLVFETRPSAEAPWRLFYRTLQHEALGFGQNGARGMVCRYAAHGDRDNPDLQDLAWDVESHALAGLIFTAPPFCLAHLPEFWQPDMPRVAIMAGALGEYPVVYVDMDAFLDRALDRLAERKRKRLAAVNMTFVMDDRYPALLETAARRRGIALVPNGVQWCHPDLPAAATSLVRLLVQGPRAERPDALLVNDDHLVAPVAAGLLAAGVKVGEELDVIAHANFPLQEPSPAVIVRLGFDCREILRTCAASLDAQRAGRTVPELTRVKPVFAEEWAARAAAGQDADGVAAT